MKKFTLLIGVVFMLMLFSACQELGTSLTPEQRANYAFSNATRRLDTFFEEHQEIEEDLLVPLNFESIPGLEIIWTSSERSILSDYGIFNHPNIDLVITMRATMIHGTFIYNKTYTVLAKALIIDIEDPIDKPVVDYLSVSSGLSELGLHTHLKNDKGTYMMDTFYGIQGIVVSLNGQNQALIFSEGSFIMIEGLLGVEALQQHFYYNISGRLVYDKHVPKLKVDKKLSTIEWIDQVGFEESEYTNTELSSLYETQLSSIISFAQAVIVEGYINHYALSDANKTYNIEVTADYDEDLNGRYVQIESIIYFDSSQGFWIFLEDTFVIKEILAPCPVC